ncbi:hypothetical protein HWI79_3380 [Cryptosporidium felis]|nr:hypothetical protein HWI79_3380 [Cryptosporidium felis]
MTGASCSPWTAPRRLPESELKIKRSPRGLGLTWWSIIEGGLIWWLLGALDSESCLDLALALAPAESISLRSEPPLGPKLSILEASRAVLLSPRTAGALLVSMLWETPESSREERIMYLSSTRNEALEWQELLRPEVPLGERESQGMDGKAGVGSVDGVNAAHIDGIPDFDGALLAAGTKNGPVLRNPDVVDGPRVLVSGMRGGEGFVGV